MKLLVYRRGGKAFSGIYWRSKVINAEELLRSYLESRGVAFETTFLNPWAFYRLGTASLKVLEEALSEVDPKGFTEDIDVENEILEPPVPQPSKIVGMGLNYLSHVKEIGAKMPKEPVPFLKAPSSLIGHNDKIVIPPDLNKVDYEIELVLVIGKKVKYASKSEALSSIMGLSIGNDVSARDVQIDRRRPWSWAKSYDTFSPLGPFVTTCDEVNCVDPDLRMTLRLNGEVMQDSRTSEMIFKPYEIVMFVSRIMTLYPGDLIFTGTPSGVGFTREPPVYLKEGDVLELHIESLGTLRNYVRKA